MGEYVLATVFGYPAAVALLVTFAWISLRTPPQGPQWLVIRKSRLLCWLSGQLRCRSCSNVRALFVDRRCNDRLFKLKAMLTGGIWKPRWMFWPGSLKPSLAMMRSAVFGRLGSKLAQTWFCRCWARVPVGGYADRLVRRERRLLRQHGFSSASGDRQYLLGLSPAVARLPIVRASIADHELVHMIQDAACDIFVRARALRRRSAGLRGGVSYVLLFALVELHAWVFGSTFLCALLMGPPVVGAVWTIRVYIA